MDRALNLIPLRPGASLADFERFSEEVDRPLLRRLPGVSRFDAYAVERTEGGTAAFDIVEIMEADSWEDWVELRDGGAHEGLVAAGEEFTRLVDPDSVVTVILRDLEQSTQRD